MDAKVLSSSTMSAASFAVSVPVQREGEGQKTGAGHRLLSGGTVSANPSLWRRCLPANNGGLMA